MIAANILIIDDEPLMRMSIGDALRADGCSVTETGLGTEGMNLIKGNGFDIVITDFRLTDTDGLEVLKAAKRQSPETMVILITAFGSIDNAVEAMKHGAYDYLTKPFPMDELLMMVKRVMRLKNLEEENRLLKEQVEGRYDLSGIISRSDVMRGVLERVKTVAETDTTVLILGESGTGKELVANALHYNSHRKNGPFIKISCAALPDTLLEAELFGYEKGAFTGAVRQKKGRFELADKGTIFLDEIGEVSPAVQVKLLRVLQEKEFDRLGGTGTTPVDVRVICATQRDLKQEVQKGAFREDLYYRLNVVPVMLPPLRDRKADILLLAGHFLKTFTARHKKAIRGFSAGAEEFLLRHGFPGNIRELENAVERAVVLARGDLVERRDLADEENAADVPEAHGSLSKAVKEFERRFILKALGEAKGNKGLAAKVLGISRKTLWEKCKLFDITVQGEDAGQG